MGGAHRGPELGKAMISWWTQDRESIGLTGSLSFKVNDNFSLGAGVIIQRTSGFVSQNLDLYASAANSRAWAGFRSRLRTRPR